MAHITLDSEDGRRVQFATRCWVCGECVDAELRRTKRHGLWILFVQPCKEECGLVETPARPAIKDYDAGSSSAQRAEEDRRAVQEDHIG